MLSADLSVKGVLAVSRREGTGAFKLECPLGQVRLDSGSDFASLRFSADGTQLAYLEYPHSGDSWGRVGLLDVATGRSRILTEGFQNAIGLGWHGEEVWFTAADSGPLKALWAVTPAGRKRLLLRSPVDLTLLDVAPDGRILLATEQLAPRLYMAAKGRAEPRELTKGWYPVPVGLSAEGGRLLYQDQTEPRDLNYDLYLQPLPEGPAQHLGPTATYAALAPDGSRVVAFQGNPMHPVIIPLGPGTARHLPNHGIADFPSFTHWTVDGRKLILTGRRPGEDQLHAYLQDISTGELQSLGPAGTQGGLPAPDGHRILARVHGQRVILDLAAPDAPGTPIEGLRPGEQIVGWSPDSSRLVLCGPLPGGIQTTHLDPVSGRREPWIRFDTPGLHVRRFGAPPRISEDGRTLVFSNLAWSSSLFLVEGLR